MRKRSLKLTQTYSLFLFGARGVGKSTLIEATYDLSKCIYINLLDSIEEDRFSRNPNELISIVEGAADTCTHIIIDEIQKIPKLIAKRFVFHKTPEIKKLTIL